MVWVALLAAGLLAIGGVWVYVLTADLWWGTGAVTQVREQAEEAWKWTAEVLKRPARQLPYTIKSLGKGK